MNKGLVAVLLAIIAIVIIAALWTSILLIMRKSSKRSAISLSKNSKIEENSAEYLIQKSSCSNLGKSSLFLPSLWSIKGMNMSMGKDMKLRFNNISGDCNKTVICIYQENNNIMISYWSNESNEYLIASVLPLTSSSNTTSLNIENCEINITVMNMSKNKTKENNSSNNTTSTNNNTTSSTSQTSSSSQSSSSSTTINPAQQEYEEALKSCQSLGGTLVNKSTIEQDIFNQGFYQADFYYYTLFYCTVGTVYIKGLEPTCSNVNYFCSVYEGGETILYYWDSTDNTFVRANYIKIDCVYYFLADVYLDCEPAQTCSFSCEAGGGSFWYFF